MQVFETEGDSKWNMSNGAAENGVDRQVNSSGCLFLSDHMLHQSQAADQDQQGGGQRGDGGGKRGGGSYVPPHLRSLSLFVTISNI